MEEIKIRKIATYIDEARSEADIEADRPLRKVAVAAVLTNPFARLPYQHDLSLLIEASGKIGREMTSIGIDALLPYSAESYGKGAIIGMAGEQEHGVALLTTVFGNVMREAAKGGKAWISSFTKYGAPGAAIDIPLAHKDALYVRSHYDGMTIAISDAPRPEEVVLICCYASRGRLNARVGGLTVDEMKGVDGLV